MSATPSPASKPPPSAALVWSRRLAPFAAVAVFALAVWALRAELRQTPVSEMAASFAAISPGQIAAAVALTLVSYAFIANVDWLGMRYTPARISYRRAALASMTSYAVANVAGVGAFSANAVRLRLYSAWGLDAAVVATVAVVTAAAMFLGAAAAFGVGLLAAAPALSAQWEPPPAALRAIGAALLAGAALAAGVAALGKPERRLAGAELRRPPRAYPVLQILVAAGDWLACASVLWALLPPDARPDFFAFAAPFVLASVGGNATGLPGGIGAFEAAIIFSAPRGAEQHYAAALVAYRLIYFLGPLLCAGGGLAWAAREPIGRTLTASRQRFDAAAFAIAPAAFAALTFLAGALTLASVATPALADRLKMLGRLLPQAVIETSHFLASLVGVLLLAAASGLQRRLRGAWGLTLALLAAAAALSLLKGADWEEAGLLAALFAVLAASRNAFYRKGGAASLKLASPWLAAMACALIAVGWIGAFAYRHVEYRDELWWTFVLSGDAPRSLRAAAGAAVLTALVFVWRWMQPGSPEPPLVSPDDPRIPEVISAADCAHADANLAYLGDKRLLFSASGRSFLQFGVHGRSWVAMGEPAGLEAERRELVWRFREEADRHSAWPVFYAVRKEALPDLIELGLAAQKIGETALVPLGEFSLDGSRRAGLRHARNRALREGCAFELRAPGPLNALGGALAAELKAVSDAWLSIHGGKEKGFTLGRFDEAYLARFPLAIVRVEGRVVAFANVWTTADRAELSVDLMRHAPGAPNGVMDDLLIELALWGQQEGYRELDLGMAPLAGLEGRRLAPMLTRLGAFVFDHAEAIYGFEGLRAYKEKFDPVWEPLYLAAPSRMILPIALGDVALMTSGGVLAAFRRAEPKRKRVEEG